MKQKHLLQCKRLRLDAREKDEIKPIKASFYFYLQSDTNGEPRIATRTSRVSQQPQQQNKYGGLVMKNSTTASHHLKLSPVTYNVKFNPAPDNLNNNNNKNIRTLNRRWLNTEANERITGVEEKGFLVLSTKQNQLRTLCDKDNVTSLVIDKHKPKYNKDCIGTQERKKKFPLLLDRHDQSKRNDFDDAYYHQHQLDNTSSSIMKDDAKIMEEAIVRNSIRKCEMWLKKYF